MNFFTQIKNLLRVSRTETNGYFLLLLLSFAIVLSPLILRRCGEGEPVITDEDMALIDSLTAISAEEKDKETRREISMFDPNTASLRRLEDLGIPYTIAERIIHYREKGGQFRRKEDLGKIYGLDSSLFAILYNYIEINTNSDRGYDGSPLDINKASYAQISGLDVVNDRISTRIINYGKKLGGYVHLDQLYEVYELDSSRVVSLKEKLYVARDFSPARIDINQSGFEVMAGHPYISDELAGAIIQYRQLNGDIRDAEELKHFRSVDQHRIDKLFPYLEF